MVDGKIRSPREKVRALREGRSVRNFLCSDGTTSRLLDCGPPARRHAALEEPKVQELALRLATTGPVEDLDQQQLEEAVF